MSSEIVEKIFPLYVLLKCKKYQNKTFKPIHSRVTIPFGSGSYIGQAAGPELTKWRRALSFFVMLSTRGAMSGLPLM
jgi:hypothetical protein